MKKIIIGSRGSQLALWQSEYIKAQIEKHDNSVTAEIKVISTKGDRILDTAIPEIGDKGLFTREIENELLEGTIDIAVHSLKDLETSLRDELTIGCITKREHAEDVLIARSKDTIIFDLKENAVVATGSLRRKAQLLHLRPDITCVDVRGNVNTRIDKFLGSDWDAIILARAGVERLGLSRHISSVISFSEMLPAAGQGALAVECRSDNSCVLEILSALNDEDTRLAVTAERSFLNALNGGCQVPVGAFAEVKSSGLYLDGVVASLDGCVTYRKRMRGSRSNPVELGVNLAKDLIEAGAGDILEEKTGRLK